VSGEPTISMPMCPNSIAFSHRMLFCSLPDSETSEGDIFKVKEDYLALLDEAMVRETKGLLVAAQYRTRVRVEPILKEMKEELDSFGVTD
jgi:hypothetical protein